MTSKNDRALLLCYFKLCASRFSHRSFRTGVIVQKCQIRVRIGNFLSGVTLNFDEWPWKTIGHLFYAASSFMRHLITISRFKVELQFRNSKFWSKSAFFLPCDLEIWQMTSKNNRAHLFTYFKLCASFRSHLWIETGLTVQKCPIRVKIGDFLSHMTLKFDGWPWKTIGHLFYTCHTKLCVSFHAICEFKLELQSGNGLTGFWLLWPLPLTSDLDPLHGHHFCQW